jgi:hypothetical protein
VTDLWPTLNGLICRTVYGCHSARDMAMFKLAFHAFIFSFVFNTVLLMDV